LTYVTIVIRIVKVNSWNKRNNLVEPENNIKEINLCEINTIPDDNHDNQYLEFEIVNDTRQINYDTNYCDNNSENNKFKSNNIPNKTETTNTFQKENNIFFFFFFFFLLKKKKKIFFFFYYFFFD